MKLYFLEKFAIIFKRSKLIHLFIVYSLLYLLNSLYIKVKFFKFKIYIIIKKKIYENITYSIFIR